MKPFLMSHSAQADGDALRELTTDELNLISGGGGGEMEVMPGTGTFTRTLRGGQWHDDGIQDDSSHGPI